MGRYGNTGISKGTLGNPQQGFANGLYANKVGKLQYKLDIQLFGEFPKNEAQIKHILRDAEGHLVDNVKNRALLISLSNDSKSYLGTDKNGVQWYAKTIGSKQLWVSVRNNVIQNGGLNDEPVQYFDGLGLRKNNILIKRRKK